MERIEEFRLAAPAQARRKRRLSVAFAATEAQVRAAQELRWRVFAEELGARLASREPGLDADRFDPHCEHLLVRDEDSGEVVGTYRLLPPHAARDLGGYYAESEFDLTRLEHLRERMVEVGRSCIHPDYRTGGAIALLWSGLARYMLAHGYRHLAGCASMGMRDGGPGAAAVYRRLREANLAPADYRVSARCRLPLEQLGAETPPEAPALLKAYLRCGAWICGEPAWDPDFNTADFFVLLPMANLAARYARHFLGADPGARVT